MAADLIDFRGKLTSRGYCAIAAHARAHDVDKSEVVRAIVDEWAAKQIHGASMLARCLRAKGESAAAEGIARAAQGIAGSDGESLAWEDE